MRDRLRAAVVAVAAVRAELALALLVIAGWGALTVGIARIVPAAGRSAVWPFSMGVLLLSASGWGLLGRIAFRGLYVVLRRRANT